MNEKGFSLTINGIETAEDVAIISCLAEFSMKWDKGNYRPGEVMQRVLIEHLFDLAEFFSSQYIKNATDTNKLFFAGRAFWFSSDHANAEILKASRYLAESIEDTLGTIRRVKEDTNQP